ncbi:aspartyl protease family protein [Anaerolineales bacterium HSG24]|nr:aspartyl protease family protein [Anaerolineales bacterium HSG24]
MNVQTFTYSSKYEPSAPVVEIMVCKTGQTDNGVVLSALIDSGADATMLPITTLQTIGARYVETRQMRGVTGVALTVDLYVVMIQIGRQVIHAIRAVATQDDEAIIGRDVLNQLVVTLNGPAEVTEMSFY